MYRYVVIIEALTQNEFTQQLHSEQMIMFVEAENLFEAVQK